MYNITRMKIRTNLTTFLSVLGIFCLSYAFGQDDRLPDLDYGAGNNRENRVEPSPDGLSDVELKAQQRNTTTTSSSSTTTAPTTATRDNTQEAKPTNKKPESKPKNEQDASVLNFNFLYYLIERFKLSDIVD